ncbi:hypothetical protein [Agromyces sp. CCNWLW203]|uniref:hypothetical protein n=1 Tax=Agromyces sp. CCNWLW203 TaxID=3112842 RepID=UPI002F962F2F
MNRPVRTAAAALAGATLIAAIAITGSTRETDAAWSAGEAAAGSFTAMTVGTPTIVGCTAGGNIVAPTLSMRWSFPAGSGYSVPTNANLYFSNNGLIPNLLPITTGATTTGPDGGGVYTTTYDIGLLGGILSTQAAIAVESKVGTWTSPRVSRIATWPLLIGTATCTAP